MKRLTPQLMAYSGLQRNYMSEETTETLDSTNETTEEVVNTEEVEETSTQEETEDLEALKEKNEKLFARAKKAEAEAKLLKAERLKAEEQAKRTDPPAQEFTVSLRDQIALTRANIHEDDVEDVMDYAKYKNISIAEALKHPVVQATLKDKLEQRKTAEVTNTSGSKRVSTKVSDETKLDQAGKGNLPDEPEELVEARWNTKKRK